MRALWVGLCDGGCFLLLWAASWLMPRGLREEWFREWRAELWYARRDGGGGAGLRANLSLVKFCLGAVADAQALRARG